MRIDTLDTLDLNEEAIIESNNIKSTNRQNVINQGLSDGSLIKCLYRSPLGDPTAYLVKNIIIALRQEDSKFINIIKDSNGPY